MYQPERDIQFVRAMASDLKAYLLSDTLYWSLQQRAGLLQNRLPKGTLGSLLMRLRRLEALEGSLFSDQVTDYHIARNQTHEQLERWFSQAEDKAVREIKARIGLWGAFLDELIEDRRNVNYLSEYRTQVKHRTILPFLRETAGRAINGSGTTSRVTLLDQKLEGLVEEGPFVWDEALEPVYPAEEFWWLYVQVRK